MLPAPHRMRRSAEFSATVRRGSKGRSQRVVVHLTTHEESDTPTLVGFVVPKSVGKAVQRNLVKRRLRAHMAQELTAIPTGYQVVVRALPGAADAPFARISEDLTRALSSAKERRDKKKRV